jgi:N-carbamoylputrescine amidase
MSCSADTASNVAKAEALIRTAAARGAHIILVQELFESLYFCQDQVGSNFSLAKPLDASHPTLRHFCKLAAELNVVLPVSLFERANCAFFNSVVMIDADGSTLPGVYRKSHIPDGPGYQEKFYFSPGDSGFKVWHTRFGCVGVAICWDQWFPECARAMALAGAEVILYPTAIGSEPAAPALDSRPHWTRTMQGHSAANLVPVVASNRVGLERSLDGKSEITFYGGSFITDCTGAIVQLADDHADGVVLTHTFDLDANRTQRASWGLFRDRRPELYGALLSLDGSRRRRCRRS